MENDEDLFNNRTHISRVIAVKHLTNKINAAKKTIEQINREYITSNTIWINSGTLNKLKAQKDEIDRLIIHLQKQKTNILKNLPVDKNTIDLL